jgi:hypothetical protein
VGIEALCSTIVSNRYNTVKQTIGDYLREQLMDHKIDVFELQNISERVEILFPKILMKISC